MFAHFQECIQMVVFHLCSLESHQLHILSVCVCVCVSLCLSLCVCVCVCVNNNTVDSDHTRYALHIVTRESDIVLTTQTIANTQQECLSLHYVHWSTIQLFPRHINYPNLPVLWLHRGRRCWLQCAVHFHC